MSQEHHRPASAKKEKEAENAHANNAQDAAASSDVQEELIQQLRQEAQTAKEQYVRAVADFENARKRLQREKEEFAKYSTETIIRELLPILDSLSQALVAVDKQSDADAVVKGVHLIYRQLLGLLEKEGVKRVGSVGQKFDPHVHEAVAHIDAPKETQDKVVEEVQTGYTLHGRLIRPALVKVGRHSSTDLGQTGDSEPDWLENKGEEGRSSSCGCD